MEFTTFYNNGKPHGSPYSPTIAQQVRPGAHAFSEPMVFSAEKGGWINEAQVKSNGTFSPGGKQSGNGNLRLSPPKQIANGGSSMFTAGIQNTYHEVEVGTEERANVWHSAIKLGPTEKFVHDRAAANPFEVARYWPQESEMRGWYPKQGSRGAGLM